MRAVVVGIANVTTTLPVFGFPIDYAPVRYVPGRIEMGVGGVGVTEARILKILGAQVSLICPLADDGASAEVMDALNREGIGLLRYANSVGSTPRSVVMFADDGRRMVNTDLGEAMDARIDLDGYAAELPSTDAVILGNLDFCRTLIPLTKAKGVPVVVDCQDIQGLENPYDQDFFDADVLTMSHERLAPPYEPFLRGLRDRSRARLLVLNLGAEGCLALDRTGDHSWHTPGLLPRPGMNTDGAGDAFTAALTYFVFGQGYDHHAAVQAATEVAAGKIRGHYPAG